MARVALPVGLERDRQNELVRGYVAEQFTSRDMVTDVAVHRQDPVNPHGHMLLTMRPIKGDRFGPKERQWNSTQTLLRWRESLRDPGGKSGSTTGAIGIEG